MVDALPTLAGTCNRNNQVVAFLRIDLLPAFPTPTLLTSMEMPCTAQKVFDTIMCEEKRREWDVAASMFNVLEKKDAHNDIIRVVTRPLWLPTFIWAAPRELVLLRYWAREEDGTYYIFTVSTQHGAAPPDDSKMIRAAIPQAVWIIKPDGYAHARNELEPGRPRCCHVTYMLNLDPGGFYGYLNKLAATLEVFYFPFLRNVASLSNWLVNEAHSSAPCPGPVDPTDSDVFEADKPATSLRMSTARSSAAARQRTASMTVDDTEKRPWMVRFDPEMLYVNHIDIVCGIDAVSKTLPADMYAEPASHKFKVRGPTYLTKKAKVPAAQSILHLVAFDMYGFETKEEVFDVMGQPGSFASQYKDEARGGMDKFTFVVNLIVPSKASSDTVCVVMCFQPEDPTWATNDDPR